MQPQRVRDLHSEGEMFQWYQDADENGDGDLSINEFFTWSLAKSTAGGGGAAILKQAFTKYDPNGSGSLDCDEFKTMARDMGFGHMAAEAFAVLDDDCSGYITYQELLASLMEKTPRNTETKKLLFGCIWSWGQDQMNPPKKRPPVDTSKWRIRSQDSDTVCEELRALLRNSGAHVADLCSLFDDDAGGALTIDEGEFMKALKRWGFRGIPAVLDDVFATINTSGSGVIDYDEFFEFVRGHRHALDARARNAAVRELTVDLPESASFTLGDIAWDVEPSAYESVESLRLLIQQMLVRHSCSPSDLMRAWDRSGDKQLDKREFVANIKRLFRKHLDVWKKELHRVAEAAFTIIQDDGVDINATQMDIIELEQWLDMPTRRKPDNQLPLKPRRNAEIQKQELRRQPVPARPGCDIPSRAGAAVAAAKAAAEAKKRHEAMAEKERARLWAISHQSQPGGQKWQLPPLQRWEMPSSVADKKKYRRGKVPTAPVGKSPRKPDASPRDRSPPASRANLRSPRQLLDPLSDRPWTVHGKEGAGAEAGISPRAMAAHNAMAAHMAALGLGTIMVEREPYGRMLPSQMASLRSNYGPDPWVD